MAVWGANCLKQILPRSGVLYMCVHVLYTSVISEVHACECKVTIVTCSFSVNIVYSNVHVLCMASGCEMYDTPVNYDKWVTTSIADMLYSTDTLMLLYKLTDVSSYPQSLLFTFI